MSETGAPASSIKGMLLATCESTAFGSVTERIPVEMMPLANLPFIGRVVGNLAALGIKDITVIASHHVDTISNFLGEGSRWGCSIRIISVGSLAQGFARIPELIGSVFILLGTAHTLPALDPNQLKAAVAIGGASFKRSDSKSSGWALVKRELLGDGLRSCKSLDEFESLLNAAKIPELPAGEPLLICDSPANLLLSSRYLLEGLRPEQLIPGASAEKGVYISRNVVLHPTVQIRPPVVIGQDCNIDRGVHIGPHVVIGEKSILGAHTTLENAIVFSGTYIGPHLELADVVADHNCLAYRDASGAVPVPDPFLLSASEGEGIWPGLRRLVRRVFAVCVLIPLWPLIPLFYVLGILMGVKNVMRRFDAVRIPAALDPALWKTFKYVEFNVNEPGIWQSMVKALRITRLPTFWNMACGNVGCFGIRPLSIEQVSALPSDWRQMYCKGTVGIIRLAELDQIHAGSESDDQTYSSEAYYVATASFKNNLHIFWRAIWRR